MKANVIPTVLFVIFCSMFTTIHCYAYSSIKTEAKSVERIENDCDGPQYIDASTCTATHLFASDRDLNTAYKWLIGNLPSDEAVKLKSDQIVWIKERNNVCKLSSEDSRGENWISKILKNQIKTKCVMRYSKARTVELDNMIEKQKSLASLSKYSPQDYIFYSDLAHEHGLWYFEVLVNAAQIAKTSPVDITLSCRPSNTDNYLPAVGFNTNYKPMINATGENLIGLAIDLNKGKLYSSMNGIWQHGKPGSSEGLDISLGYPWKCGVKSNELVNDLIKRKLIEVNFGGSPFHFIPPTGYKPYKGDSLWVPYGIETKGVSNAIDYASINLKSDRPAVVFKQELNNWTTIESSNLKYKAILINMEVECTALKAKDAGSYFMTDKYAYVANMVNHVQFDNKSTKPLIQTVCFLHDHNLILPDISTEGHWEPMLSPDPSVKIYEAVDKRQFDKGYLIVKQKNEMNIGSAVNKERGGTIVGILDQLESWAYSTVNGESKTIVFYNVFNCNARTAHHLIAIPYGDHGNILDTAYYDEEDSYPKLPENKKRFEDICKAYSVNLN